MTTPRVTVPVEPTREMWAAGANAVVGYKQRHHDKVVEQVWTAMLAAAPAPEGGLTVTLVETSPHLPAAGSMVIRKWDNHGLPAGTHHLCASPDTALKAAKEALRHYRCSCEPGHCAMSADDTDTPVDEQMCGRRASKALAVLEGGAA